MIKTLNKKGYGQVEINKMAARRNGQIEAQSALDTEFFTNGKVGENGMILKVVKVGGKNIMTPISTKVGKFCLVATVEKQYDPRESLKDFFIDPNGVYPRGYYFNEGDSFTTNTVCYDTTDFANEEALWTAIKTATAAAPLYATANSETGYIQIVKAAPGNGLAILVEKATTMPDGQKAIKFRV